MKSLFFFVAIFLALTLEYGESAATFRFANIFGDNMVLQRSPQRATVWGFGEVGQDVLLVFDGEMYRSEVIPDKNGVGRWSTLLTPQLPGGPYSIEAHSIINGGKVTTSLQGILFGDVWICSGQSNMEFTVIQSANGTAAINDSVKYPNIRVFTADRVESDTPLSELSKVMLPWSVPSPESIGGPEWEYFSAVCWYYGVELYKKLNYPIGLIASSWGGTPIEAWSSPDALKKCNISKHIGTRKLFRRGVSVMPQNSSVLWNAMIYPFVNMTIYGTIWYQGEQNAEHYSHSYNCTFPAMIDDWRAKWYESTQQNTGNDFPFGFVQLSAVGNNITGQAYNFAELRWNQTCQYGYVPNNRQKRVFMAVAMDLGNPHSKAGAIHPPDKTDVGIRLSLGSLSIAYGINVYYSGPLVSEITEFHNVVLIKFRSLMDNKIEIISNKGFEFLCGGQWKATEIIDYSLDSVVIGPKTGCIPQAVRYAWSDYPCIMKQCAIYSGNLPAPPFIKYSPFQ